MNDEYPMMPFEHKCKQNGPIRRRMTSETLNKIYINSKQYLFGVLILNFFICPIINCVMEWNSKFK